MAKNPHKRKQLPNHIYWLTAENQ